MGTADTQSTSLKQLHKSHKTPKFLVTAVFTIIKVSSTAFKTVAYLFVYHQISYVCHSASLKECSATFEECSASLKEYSATFEECSASLKEYSASLKECSTTYLSDSFVNVCRFQSAFYRQILEVNQL